MPPGLGAHSIPPPGTWRLPGSPIPAEERKTRNSPFQVQGPPGMPGCEILSLRKARQLLVTGPCPASRSGVTDSLKDA